MDYDSENGEDGQDGNLSTTGRLATAPSTNIPPAPCQHTAVKPEAIASSLSELEHMECRIVQAQHRLKERRARKDSRNARERAIQDWSIQQLLDTRGHQDSQVTQRRQKEDEVFHRWYQDMDELENRLRRHWKLLRRGLPFDDTAASISSEATPHRDQVPIKPSPAARTPGRAEYTVLHRAPCLAPSTSPASLRRDVYGRAEHIASASRPAASDTAINDHDRAHHAAVAGPHALSGYTPASTAPPLP
ncbi:hypothetical protein LTR70_002441 [Exophiala xenobiotica]|uniref:Uncharacterized protein n=1 Tax=Lithohypha guttulata TaxID=1690604 RepID=A0ABR0KKW9_9EURO|nr:hypothetical protein LTR24_001438 [Lithohypha guttulata]KAK5325469.1 hypothetical protein LTR70_002441 [Exophiala xenobiotica]